MGGANMGRQACWKAAAMLAGRREEGAGDGTGKSMAWAGVA